MFMPAKTKFRRARKGRIHGMAKGNVNIAFGSFGLQALQPERISGRQIESARRAMTRHIKRQGKVWIRIFPHTPVSKRALGVRMGGGKGPVDRWVAKVKPGCIMFEIDGVPEKLAREALELAAYKLPIRTKFVKRLLNE
ncbi:MAG: 50S ribosomal protein L16 [Alphaproteobacteria bacterium]|nr:50S ribosomal protein L16 [Alphaproteobacteria bacterium]MBL0718172.1 50S ribosomal protein L16 [Alphaproteobacteria bacterium]